MWGDCVGFSQEVTPLGGAPSVSRRSGFCFVSLFFLSIGSFSDESRVVLASQVRLTHTTYHVWFDCTRPKQRHAYPVLSFVTCLFLARLWLHLNNCYYVMVQSLNSVFYVPFFKAYEVGDLRTGSYGVHQTPIELWEPCLAATHMPRWQVHLGRSSVFAL